MKDSHETSLPAEEPGKPEEAKAPADMPENSTEEITVEESIVTENATEEDDVAAPPVTHDVPEETLPVNNTRLTKEKILGKLENLANASEETLRNDTELLKQAFYRIRKAEADEQKKAFIEGGGEEKDFQPTEDETDTGIKTLLNNYKERKAVSYVKEEEIKAANYALKLQLISRMKELTESREDFNKLYNEFKEIQQRWKEAKLVPQEHAGELWKNYQTYSERFYDLIKINHQFRDYDFRKNLSLKTTLCETAEKLGDETDTVQAYYRLQKLRQQWRDTGPVAKDARESLWVRFKAASAIINKRYQEYYEQAKTREQENLKAKTALCERIENIDYSLLKTHKDWDAQSVEVFAIQEEWKKIGFAPKKLNTKIFERFRAACNIYFNRKGEFFKSRRAEADKRLEVKRNLCKRAEELKNSTDWKETTEKFTALQKEWKESGSVPRKYSEAIWRQFISACDYFFEQKSKSLPSHKGAEQSNLAAKKELIEKINSLDTSLEHDEAISLMKEYMAEWNAIGFVPFHEKDKLYKEYRAAADKQFDRLNVGRNDRKMQSYRSNAGDTGGGEKGKGKLYGERDKLMRAYERLKSELQTYENNIGFLSISSKGGGGLVREMERKIEKLKEDMALVIRKIDAIDENLE
jgi:hypothetical protein